MFTFVHLRRSSQFWCRCSFGLETGCFVADLVQDGLLCTRRKTANYKRSWNMRLFYCERQKTWEKRSFKVPGTAAQSLSTATIAESCTATTSLDIFPPFKRHIFPTFRHFWFTRCVTKMIVSIFSVKTLPSLMWRWKQCGAETRKWLIVKGWKIILRSFSYFKVKCSTPKRKVGTLLSASNATQRNTRSLASPLGIIVKTNIS